ncbi:sugar phosphate nucleotidyltransferase [Nocardioides sp. 616]|uniref:glucose-1-phosphate adenylyltransferase family protein n=1 Tax=Nocardioides sp. 616 TaxID=2268090 RepID=UPI000CE3D26E|nr:sugar phosphate nucleotidyltransferase [Nocardioides sp. 616]
MRQDVLAVVQAGGQGSRMDVLTRERAKPALPYAGSHRLIDFALSSMVHSGLRDVWVSLEYQVASIDEYLSGGRPWDLDAGRRGFRRIVPQTGSGPASEDGFAFGNGDLLLRMAHDLEGRAARTLVVTSADHIFNADLRDAIAEHQSSGAAVTVMTAEVTKKEASHNVVIEAGSDGRITGVAEKPARPSTGVVATEVILYETAPLLEQLFALRAKLAGRSDDADSGIGDFGEHLLPALVAAGAARAAPLPGYWRDLGRPDAYLQGHRDLLAGEVDVFDHPDRPVLTHWPDRWASRVRPGARVEDSLLAPGADVAGTVRRSVLGPGVVVEAGAVVEDSVLFADTVVRRGATVSTSIVDERAEIESDSRVGELPSARLARDEDLVLLGIDTRVGQGVRVAPGARLEPGGTA